MNFTPIHNPRFVWNVGSVQEQFPDMPEQGNDTVLWDRQEKKPVVTLHADYQQAFCLETTRDRDYALTALELWFNRIDNKALESEGMKPTLEYDGSDYRAPGYINDSGCIGSV